MSTLYFPSVSPVASATYKENAGKIAPVIGRKRTITTMNGEIDLNKRFNATPEIVEALKQRIFQLEDALEAAASQEPPAKRAKTSASASAVAGPSTTTQLSKAEEKKRKMHLKKIFDRLKKECKSDACKFQGSRKTIKFDEVLDVADFEAIFSGKGKLIQPTPNNKPKSTVTIIEFNSAAQIEALFGDELKALKGNKWTRGGVPVRSFGFGFGGGSTFSKSVKQGTVDVSIHSLEINYSKNSMKCALKFEVGEVGGHDYGYDSDFF